METFKKITPVRAVLFPLRLVFLFSLGLSSHDAEQLNLTLTVSVFKALYPVLSKHTRGRQS